VESREIEARIERRRRFYSPFMSVDRCGPLFPSKTRAETRDVSFLLGYRFVACAIPYLPLPPLQLRVARATLESKDKPAGLFRPFQDVTIPK